ncbi:MAG: carboxylating nicotinate-nucleotide diphosphorylase [Actinobacteria bacterium]|uniref:Probable nicotinate-nucleotide pyrophosphorylase [carboxylating] n=1 Tax=freshwater metagenome TaxID=449393 RepID=A0A6J6D6P4_9ZZZZ|nr:carboxylating nicotinate-nucleotide diphosphorylase [Actinomycetota bacterium]
MLDQKQIEDVVALALREDAPNGDITSESLIPEDAIAEAELSAREPGVFSGSAVFIAAFKLTDPRVTVTMHITDGQPFEAGQSLATVTGPARAILTAERIGLNFTQRMCGIATLTSSYVEKTRGTKAEILDTRKTTPLLRAFERQAVLDGGARNHRFSLSDMVMAKDNHLAVLTHGGKDLTTELSRVKAELPSGIKLEVEVDRIDQIAPVLAAGVDVIMLDNFSLSNLREGVALIAGRCKIEASGGVNLNTVADIAQTGVDFISVGALTHSARALDLGLDVNIQLGAD